MARDGTLLNFFPIPQSGTITGYSVAIASLADANEIRSVVGALRFTHMDQYGGTPNIAKRRTVRLDRQKNAGSGDGLMANFQVQVNDEAGRIPANAGTSIGQVLVPCAIHRAVKNHKASANLQSRLESAVRRALLASCGGGGTWYIIGAAPATS